MHASAVAFSVIKLLGVAYLLYLAWKTFRDKSVFEFQARCAASPQNASSAPTPTSTRRVEG
jgi:threonine/homoserine/homoserine lactone efflux protein